MATLFCDKRKPWNFREGPDFGLWLVILAQFFTYIPVILAGYQDISYPTMYPQGKIELLQGKSLEIFCKEDNYSADDLTFTLRDHTRLPSEKVNSTTRRFHSNNLPTGVRVIVDSVPLNVTNFACKSDNLDKLNCSWNGVPESVAIVKYTLTTLVNNKTLDSCIAVKIQRRNGYFCSWTTDSNPRYRQMSKEFNFVLTTCNVFGCNEQKFTINHISIVQPSPVMNLRVIRSEAHRGYLTWRLPHNMVDFLPNGVRHKIEYQIRNIDNASFFREVDTSMLPIRNITYKFWLSDLPYALMQYEVKIFIRPVEATSEEFWSKHSSVVFETASDIPSRPPEAIAGAFDQHLHDGKRRINIYWKQLQKYEEIGENFTYKVVANEASNDPVTLMADTEHLSYVALDSASLGPINVYIWSVNENGSSVNSSHLFIPPVEDTESLRVSSLRKVAYDNGAYELSWTGVNNIDNYTLLWCRHNATNVCTGGLDYTILSPEKTNYVKRLPVENRYQFAISANKDDKTSGMVWAACSEVDV